LLLRGDENGTIVAATQIEMVPINAFGDRYAESVDEDAAIDAAVVACPVSELRLLLLAPP